MRLILGIIIGAGLTIGAAYMHDAKLTGPFAERQRLVNWSNAGSAAREIIASAQAQIREWTGN